MTQLVIKRTVLVTTEIDGIEMGVLSDGTPYLTLRGLARACGLAPSTISEQVKDWANGKRTGKLARFIASAGFNGDRLSIELGSNLHAVPDSICILVLEHYAFEPGNQIAAGNYRVLARHGLRTYIYNQTGYNPALVLPRGWRDFHDRLLLSKIPAGYFGVFKEMSEFLLRAIQGGLIIDEHTIPDISVGQIWGPHWERENLEAQFGPRIQCDHWYPDYYPQSKRNPHDVWVYPIKALGVFREWLDATYIPEKFPNYLNGKVKQNVLDRAAAEKLIQAVTSAVLSEGDDEDAA